MERASDIAQVKV